MEKFQKAPFEEIAAHCESKVRTQTEGVAEGVFNVFPPQANMLHDRLAQIFELTIRSGDLLTANCQPTTRCSLTAAVPAGPLPARPDWFPCQPATASTSLCPSTR